MSFTAIAAMSENRVIGRGSQIPWHLPEDFKWFKSCTIGKTVLMGRKTYESLGKPLPNRLNVVLTRNPRILAGGPEVPPIYRQAKHSSAARAALDRAQKLSIQPDLGASLSPTELVVWQDWEKLTKGLGGEVWVVGGANIYEQTLPHCSDLYLTHVKRTVDGDVFFPPFEDQFELAAELSDTPDFKILHYRRKR